MHSCDYFHISVCSYLKGAHIHNFKGIVHINQEQLASVNFALPNFRISIQKFCKKVNIKFKKKFSKNVVIISQLINFCIFDKTLLLA